MRSCSLHYSVIGGYDCRLASGTGLIGEERWIFSDKFRKCRDLELVQNISQFRFRGLEIHIRFEGPCESQTQTRVMGIDLPGMNVENHRPVLGQNFTAHLTDDRIRKQTKITAA